MATAIGGTKEPKAPSCSSWSQGFESERLDERTGQTYCAYESLLRCDQLAWYKDSFCFRRKKWIDKSKRKGPLRMDGGGLSESKSVAGLD